MTHPAPETTIAAAKRAASTPWTIERMDLFIRALLETRNVAAAARAAGMSRRSAYRLRAQLRGHPFDQAWEGAMAPRTVYRQVIADHAASHIVSPSHTESH